MMCQIGMAQRGATSSRASLWTAAAVALAVCAGGVTFWLQPKPDVAAAHSSLSSTAPSSRPAAIALIAKESRDLKLITWSFETTIDAQSVSDKWYGDAVAEVRAPVRYQYGVDLGTLEEKSIFRDANTGALTFVVKPPLRLSVEVDVERLEQSLKTSGLRWRSSNQRQLRDTVNDLGSSAKNLTLSPADEQRMREASRQQIEKHLQRVLARLEPGIVVSIKFSE